MAKETNTRTEAREGMNMAKEENAQAEVQKNESSAVMQAASTTPGVSSPCKSSQAKIDQTVMFKCSYGLYIVSTSTSDLDAGCIINTTTQVTSKPIRVMVAINNENVTCEAIKETGHFALSILDQTADLIFIGRFGFRNSREFKKFKDVSTKKTILGDIYTPEHSCGILVCSVEQTIPCATHTLFIAEIKEAEPLSNETPLTYAYYHEGLKGKTPPKASSYQGE